jgi:hypothetical protein
MNPMRPLVLALALAGCTPMQWVKEGAGAAEAERDRAECSREAWLGAYSRTTFYGHPAPVTFRDAHGRLVTFNPYGPFSDPLLLEAELAERCMRGRGYRLEELTPPR